MTVAVSTLGLVAAGDPGSTRLVYAMVIGLVIVGIAFVILGIWVIRRTRVDPPVLGPLERMGQRGWQRRDLATQRRQLDDVRPPGALPLHRHPDPPRFDADFDRVAPPASLSDLGPGLAPPVMLDAPIAVGTDERAPKDVELEVDVEVEVEGLPAPSDAEVESDADIADVESAAPDGEFAANDVESAANDVEIAANDDAERAATDDADPADEPVSTVEGDEPSGLRW